MKRILAAAASAIAIVAVMGSPARAELEVTVGGFASFQAAMFDNDVANSSDRDFTTEAQITVNADATADNGLQYGAKITLDVSTSDTANAEEVAIYLAGGWGRVELGDDDGASELVVIAPTVGIGQINGSYDDFTPVGAHMRNDRGDHAFTAIDSDNSTKVTYYTPKFSGFQAGVSYAPEYQGETILGLTVPGGNGENVTFTENTTGASNIFEIGLGYEGEFSGVMFRAGGNYIFADSLPGLEDVRAWSLGAQVGYQGFRFGGGYKNDGDSSQLTGFSDDEVAAWNVGATYENGPFGVGVSYLNIDFDTNGADAVGLTQGALGLPVTSFGGEYDAFVLGATYTIAPGLNVAADLAFYDRDNQDDGYVLMTDVTAAF